MRVVDIDVDAEVIPGEAVVVRATRVDERASDRMLDGARTYRPAQGQRVVFVDEVGRQGSGNACVHGPVSGVGCVGTRSTPPHTTPELRKAALNPITTRTRRTRARRGERRPDAIRAGRPAIRPMSVHRRSGSESRVHGSTPRSWPVASARASAAALIVGTAVYPIATAYPMDSCGLVRGFTCRLHSISSRSLIRGDGGDPAGSWLLVIVWA